MTLYSHSKFFRSLMVICLGLLCFAGRTIAADANAVASTVTNAAADADARKTEAAVIDNHDSLRSYLQIQEQLHNIEAADEKSRLEAQAAAIHNAELQQAQLEEIQKALNTQRREELKDILTIQNSNHRVLIIAGIFLIIGFVVLISAAFLQWSVANRLAYITTSLANGNLLPQGQAAAAAALGMGEGEISANTAIEQSTTRFLSIVERLEQRIHDMETNVQPRSYLTEGAAAHGENGNSASTNGGSNGSTNGNSNGNGNGHGAEAVADLNGETAPQPVAEKAESVPTLLSKGQTLLKLDKPEAALACFDEALALDPANTDALVKKGAALERLQRLIEAIECYDRAIATDKTMTMAYLYKGGVFNRMERYTEALECYERALKSQDKTHLADLVTS